MSEVGFTVEKASLVLTAPRFATELAGRKAKRKGWDGLFDEMARAGWFDS